MTIGLGTYNIGYIWSYSSPTDRYRSNSKTSQNCGAEILKVETEKMSKSEGEIDRKKLERKSEKNKSSRPGSPFPRMVSDESIDTTESEWSEKASKSKFSSFW